MDRNKAPVGGASSRHGTPALPKLGFPRSTWAWGLLRYAGSQPPSLEVLTRQVWVRNWAPGCTALCFSCGVTVKGMVRPAPAAPEMPVSEFLSPRGPPGCHCLCQHRVHSRAWRGWGRDEGMQAGASRLRRGGAPCPARMPEAELCAQSTWGTRTGTPTHV